MNIYENKSLWKVLLLVAGAVIVAASMFYTNHMARGLEDDERKKVELWADAIKRLNNLSDNTDIGFLFDIIKDNKTVPAIQTDDKGHIIKNDYINIDSVRAATDTAYIRHELDIMAAEHKPIQIDVTPTIKNYVYYRDSYLLSQLKIFPYAQLAVIMLFIGLAYYAFSSSRKSEQNRVWVGMAKETAHQLGTPLSSMSGWIEHLKNHIQPNEIPMIEEMEKDVLRLELVAERFSKIGSAPLLTVHNIGEEVTKTVDYIRKRASKNVEFHIEQVPDNNINAHINITLFNWVLENLLKNALDAMEGKGRIDVKIGRMNSRVFVDIADTGKGISRANINAVFKPGYSTKKRGWGLGLTLSKRIIENYHHGKIFVKESTPGKGTTFRIVLKG
jgi:two-component system, sporulation sensor kinase D